MCGIAGIISKKPISSNGRDALAKMQASLVHRGPDDEGVFFAPHAALAHRRLSIIDLTGGKQPLYSDDGSLALIANGEIYNYIELRDQLKAEGCHFLTDGDCEVIIHLYRKHGTACLQYLRGMFAFALWDGRRNRLMLARDRMGEKPLYIHEQDGLLIFSSEMKSLLKSGLVSFDLDPVAVNEYFFYQYVPEPKTAIKKVRKLPAGHYLLVDVEKWNVTQKRYWCMEDAPPLEGDPAKLIRAELERVSELIIRSDVPVGVALSSGLDSGAIAILAAQKFPGTLHAFSVGYPGRPPCDERGGAKALADCLGMPFHDIEISTSEMVDFFPELVYWRDDPIAEISGHSHYTIMKIAREHHVPVLLQGHGADELFWGYPWLNDAVRESTQKSEYRPVSALFEFLNTDLNLPGRWSPKGLARWGLSLAGLDEAWRRLGRIRSLPKERLVFYDLLPDYRMAMKGVRDIYSPDFQEQIALTDPAALFTLPIPWKRVDIEITRLICQTYLVEDCIAQTDRLGMASSIETRLPFVDHRLVETVIGLRKARPDHDLPSKAWLKSALKDIIPDWVINRPKTGFSPPVLEWHRQLFLKYGDLLQGGYLKTNGILKEKSARHLSTGPFPHGSAAAPLSYKALVLEMWCRKAEALTL